MPDDGMLDDGVITIEEPKPKDIEPEVKIPTEEAPKEIPEDKGTPIEVKDKEPDKPDWDKDRQIRDQMAADQRKREEAEKARDEMQKQLAEAMGQLAEQVTEMRKDTTPKEDPRAKLIEELDAMKLPDDPDDRMEYDLKQKAILKKIVSLEPEVKVQGIDRSEVEALEQKIQAMELKMVVQDGKSRLLDHVRDLDKQYGEKHHAEAIKNAMELVDQMPDGTPDEVIKRIYENEYKVLAAAEPPKTKDIPVIETDGGTGGGVGGSIEADDMSTIASYRDTLERNLKGLR